MYSLPAGTAAVTSETISSTKFNTLTGADRITFWDDSASAFGYLTLGTGLSISTTVLSLDADLSTLAGLTVAEDNFIAGNAGGTAWEVKTPAQARTSLGLVIGTNVQAWDADLDTYAGTPLTAAELGQLQNIGSVTINNTQWGYLGGLGAAPWTSANDGAGSGLDADTLDGVQASGFGQLSVANTFTAAQTVTLTTGVPLTITTGSAFSGLKFNGNGSTLGAYMGASGGALYFINSDNAAMLFGTNNLVRVTISATGDMAVPGGVTAPALMASVTTGSMTAAGNANKITRMTGNMTLTSVFAAGDHGVLLPSGAPRTITRGAGVTMYVNGVDSASATTTALGVVGWVCYSAGQVYLTGDVS